MVADGADRQMAERREVGGPGRLVEQAEQPGAISAD
jgi:hypothetical protein